MKRKPVRPYSAAWLASRSPAEQTAFLASLNRAELAHLEFDWRFWARDEQLTPPGDWRTWLVLAGRGWGKTRTGAEAVSAWARAGVSPLGIVAATAFDARAVMIEGPAGLLNVGPPDNRPEYEPSKRQLKWANGAVALVFSTEEPNRLRGPQFAAAWADEVAAWFYAEAAWDMLEFGLRLGERPRVVATTTPRPMPLLRQLMAAKDTVVTRGRTADNRLNLAPTFVDKIEAKYAGTRLGRQELDGEILEDAEGALWSRGLIEAARWRDPVPDLDRIVVAVDPPAEDKASSDACGIIVAGVRGRSRNAVAFVLADRTIQGVTPERWARQVASAAAEYGAHSIVVETNQGGAMVRSVLSIADARTPIKDVKAKTGKRARAEPVAMLYEQGRVRHAGVVPALEDQMARFGAETGGPSPDRVDALVWAITDLLIGHAEPNIRSL